LFCRRIHPKKKTLRQSQERQFGTKVEGRPTGNQSKRSDAAGMSSCLMLRSRRRGHAVSKSEREN